MIKNILAVLFVSFIIHSCDNHMKSDKEVFNTRDLPSNNNEKEDLSFSYITRKWVFGEEYLNLNKDGTFEARLNAEHSKGRWGFSSNSQNKKTLKLIGEINYKTETTNSFIETYELIDLSYSRLVLINSKGHKISFSPDGK